MPGNVYLKDGHLEEIIKLLRSKDIYAGSGRIWGGYALTPGSKEEMLSLHTEYGGAIGILLILYNIQTYMGHETVQDLHKDIWINNTKFLVRGKPK